MDKPIQVNEIFQPGYGYFHNSLPFLNRQAPKNSSLFLLFIFLLVLAAFAFFAVNGLKTAPKISRRYPKSNEYR